jgi:hypothetical protein
VVAGRAALQWIRLPGSLSPACRWSSISCVPPMSLSLFSLSKPTVTSSACLQDQHAAAGDDTGASILLASRLLLPSPGLSPYEGWLSLRPPPGSAAAPPGSQAAAVAAATRPLYGRRYVLLDPYAQRLAIFAASAPGAQPPLALVGLRGAAAAADGGEGAGPGAVTVRLRIAEGLAAGWAPAPADAGGAGNVRDPAGAGGVWGEKAAGGGGASGGRFPLVIFAEAADAAARREWLARLAAATAAGEEDGGGAHHAHHAAMGGDPAGYPAHFQAEGPGSPGDWAGGFAGQPGAADEAWAHSAAARPAAAHCQPLGAGSKSSSGGGALAGGSSPGDGGAAAPVGGGKGAAQEPPPTSGRHSTSCMASCLPALFRRQPSDAAAEGLGPPHRNAKV